MAHRGNSRHMAVVAVLSVTLAGGTLANAAVQSWQNPSGANARFSFSGGQSNDDGLNLINPGTLNPEGLWGEPTQTLTGFDFNNIRDEFEAVAVGGGNDARQSEMDVNIVPIGPAFNELHLIETGTWTGDMSALQSSTAAVEIFQPSPFIAPITFDQIPITFNVDGTWVLQFDINDVTAQFGAPFTNLFLSVTNILAANPSVGDASIKKTNVRIDLPEPATVGLLLLGAIPVVTRRRRSVAQIS